MATLEGADPAFTEAVNKLMKDTGAGLTSGYRSNAEQQKLYNAALAKYGSEQEARKWAAKPGGSNHEHGVAADISNWQNITDAQLARYGLYRPMDYEPWHVEPIGSRKATSAGYTTPPGQDATAKTLEQFQTAIASLTVGEQGADVGQDQSSVGEATSVVGEAGTGGPIVAQQEDKTTAAPTAPGAAPKASMASGGGGDQLSQLMAAIGNKESGNNYTAKNKDSGAYGKYQIMPANWPSWSKAAGLPAGAPQTPENQEKVAAFKLGEYLNKYGPEGAAQAWYGGEGSVGKTNRGGGYGGNYPTVGQYGSDIASKVK